MSECDPYSRIKKFINNSDYKDNKLVEKILLHTYYKEYNELIEQETDLESRKNLSEEVSNSYKRTLLSETNLKKNAEIALSEIDVSVDDKVKWIERKYRFKNVIGVIGINIISSAAFTLLLIILFALAENQIRPIVNSYLSTPAVKIDTTVQ